MPSFDTPIYTAQTGTAGQSPAVGYPQAKVSGGKLRYTLVPYTVDGAETTADTINICHLKKGTVVVPSECRVLSEAAFDADDMNIGIASNDNLFADAIDTTNAATNLSFTGGDALYDPAANEITTNGGEDVIATLVSVVTTTAGQKVLFVIATLDE